MENQNDNFQTTIQPSEVAGRVDVAVEECLCAYVTFCMCTGEDECFCLESKENHATSESDAVEHSGVVDQSGAVEEVITISDEKSDATEEDTGIREHPFVGRYRLEDTSTALLRCGMFALEISTSSQLGTQMTQSEFWRAYDSQEMQDFNKKNGWRNRGNFYDEQLAGVLRIWGRHHGRDNLQLGLITEGSEDVFIIGDERYDIVSSVEDMERQRDFTTVWIHNDNAQQLHGGSMSHYSGITLLGQSEEPKDASGEASSAVEDSGKEIRDDAETGQETGEENLRKILRDSEEGEYTEDLEREGSWTLAEKCESKWELQILLCQSR